MTVEAPEQLPDNSKQQSEAPEALSAKETREIVTPYAFGVADELLGQPLASPMRRLIAQCIDAGLVVLLSTAHALVLAFFVAITFFRAGKHLAEGEKKRGFARKMLRLSAACLLFFVTYVIVESYNSAPPIKELSRDSALVSSGLRVAQKYAWQSCDGDFSCYSEVAAGFGEAYGTTGDTEQEATAVFDGFIGDKDLTEAQQSELRELFVAEFAQSKASNADSEEINDEVQAAIRAGLSAGSMGVINPDQAESTPEKLSEPAVEPVLKLGLGKDNDTEKTNSLISWVDGIIKDLGLGFGWAALYYSVLTAWWRGHTIGKRIMRIKVVKLDGSPLNLFESFGRYGGYTAGIATGLLGFLQIFWDPNRQTIQDKIAETLVLYRPPGSVPIPQLISEQHSPEPADAEKE
ncbi:MAG: RDD family protein [Gammaproteobacteria bacterium]|nr:RDD family protein [Gammaproteobacteria bacterium]